MAKTKQNNLTLAKVKQVSKQVSETRTHIIEEGLYKGEQITFTPLFNDKTIEELLTEFGHLMNEADQKEIELSQQMQIYLIHMLSIKHFTHFKKDIPATLLSKGKTVGILDTLDHFHKTGLLTECLNTMFLPAEVNKLFSKMTEFAATGLLSMELDKKMVEKFEELKLKNASAFEQLDKINVENNIVS
jgi:aminoglycoside phosphotransferase family enzyme